MIKYIQITSIDQTDLNRIDKNKSKEIHILIQTHFEVNIRYCTLKLPSKVKL